MQEISALYQGMDIQLGYMPIELNGDQYNDGAELVSDVAIMLKRGDNIPSDALAYYNSYMIGR